MPGDRCSLAFALAIVACQPTKSTDRPQAEPSAVEEAEAPKFDASAVSDAPLTEKECTAFGELRAADPAEKRSPAEYAKECIETTAAEPPWMRRTTRCLLEAPTDGDRLDCFTDDLQIEREAADARLEAQIEAERARMHQEQVEEAERILREVRQSEAADGEPAAADDEGN